MAVEIWFDEKIWEKHKEAFDNILSQPIYSGGKVYFSDVPDPHWGAARTVIDEINNVANGHPGSGNSIGCEYDQGKTGLKKPYP